MTKLIEQIEVRGGVYSVRIPMGRIGAKHFAIVTKMAPSRRVDEDDDAMSPMDMQRLGDAFEQWAVEVLPHLIVEGPFKYDEMPGEDQYGIFMAMMEMLGGEEDKPLFRIV